MAVNITSGQMRGTAANSSLRPDRIAIVAALLGITLLAWTYLLRMSQMMREASSMAAMGMPMSPGWDDADLLMTFLMWVTMMVGMMVPSAMPMILAFATVQGNRAKRGEPYVATAIFLAGYLAIWTAFSILASLAQSSLHNLALLSADALAVAPWVAIGLLIAAGIFQLSPLKNACLSRCRSPLDFLGSHWREGNAGAFWLGAWHGTLCVGCCWLLMLLLFVTGVMNLPWVAIIAGFVLAEKLLPRGRLISYFGAIACFAGVIWILARSFWG